MSHWMFNCKEVSRRISESMDHLLMCKYCARFRRQIVMLREFCRSYQLNETFLDPTVILSPDARERIRKTLKSSSA